MKKIILMSIVGMILLFPSVFAQTGLFTSEGSNTFIATGVTIVIVIIIVKGVLKQIFKSKK